MDRRYRKTTGIPYGCEGQDTEENGINKGILCSEVGYSRLMMMILYIGTALCNDDDPFIQNRFRH